MGNSDSKTPTWQWVAGLAISLLLLSSSAMLLETRADIKEGRQANAAMDIRVTSIEKTMPLQFEAIKEWREEIRVSLERIVNNQRYNAEMQTNKTDTIIKGQKSAAKIKDWNDIK